MTVSARRRALVLGATGLVGSHCVLHLLERDVYERVICLVRRRSLEPSERLEERVVDFGALRASDVDGATDLFCAIGTTMKKAGSREAFRRVDCAIPLEIARLAAASGLRRVALVSSIGADPRSGSFYLRTKGELEEALGALALDALHVLRPSLLLGQRSEPRPAEAVGAAVARAMKGLLVGGLRKWRPIDAETVGRAMVGAMTGPDPRPFRQVYEYDAIVCLAGG